MRNPEEVYKAVRLLKRLRSAGLELFPLGIRSKMPRDKGFLLHDYGDPDFGAWLDQFGNWGIRARSTDLIVDVDPKNGGGQSMESLIWELDLDLSPYPYTITGSGGRHYFMRKPEGRWKWHLKGYPGIDFQGLGRYVVAPGSIHPDTGKPYVFHGDTRGGILIPPAPPALLDRLRKPQRVDEHGRAPGAILNETLAQMLRMLDASDFGAGGEHHDEWLDIAMGAHFATNGEGWEEWLAWCATDERYSEAGELNLARWDSFDANRGDGVTYRTLLRAVARTGDEGRRLVGKLRVKGESARGNNATSARDDFKGLIQEEFEDPDEFERDEEPDYD